MKKKWIIALLFSSGLAHGSWAIAQGSRECDAIPYYQYTPHSDGNYYGVPSLVDPPSSDMRSSEAPSPSADASGSVPAPSSEAMTTPATAPQSSDFASSMPSARSFNSGLIMGSSSAFNSVGAYIDDALIRTRVRTRFDSVDGGNSDRAEFLYATYDENAIGLIGLGGLQGPAGAIPQRLDYEELSTFLELALTDRFSVFTEFGIRWNDLDPVDLGGNPAVAPGTDVRATGFGDMSAGFKYALRQTESDILTFQFRVLIPTGSARNLLGTGHASLMPGLLYQEQVTDRLTFFGEIHDWIGLDTTETPDGRQMGGNVLRYGVGFGYDLMQIPAGRNGVRRLTWVNEVVGWTVLDGLSVTPFDQGPVEIRDATGDTIVNYKTGVRYSTRRNALYAGYGFAMTDKVWYDDVIRIQYERFF